MAILNVTFAFASVAARNALQSEGTAFSSGDAFVLLGYQKRASRIAALGLWSVGDVYPNSETLLIAFPASSDADIGSVQNTDYVSLFASFVDPANDIAGGVPLANESRDRWARVIVPPNTPANGLVNGAVTFDTNDNGQTVIVTYGEALVAAPGYDPFATIGGVTDMAFSPKLVLPSDSADLPGGVCDGLDVETSQYVVAVAADDSVHRVWVSSDAPKMLQFKRILATDPVRGTVKYAGAIRALYAQ